MDGKSVVRNDTLSCSAFRRVQNFQDRLRGCSFLRIAKDDMMKT